MALDTKPSRTDMLTRGGQRRWLRVPGAHGARCAQRRGLQAQARWKQAHLAAQGMAETQAREQIRCERVCSDFLLMWNG
ncbi:Hypothetical predicted protein [Marmota monax]|uniref:Uncharacterized protein n=1 Tax=Marmota monax TaxID=9995 RepID=A0A5E4BFM1_MARMO|nr:Hypothetical predicted protein [Marmota monax]